MGALDKLNDEQRIAAIKTEGAVLVTAGAGSGKTRLLTHRIAHLLQDKGISPYSILAITFTNKAAAEMKSRICSLVQNADDIWISTFHSLCARILRRHAELLGYTSSYTIYAAEDTERTIKRIIKDMKVNDDGIFKSAAAAISDAKGKGLMPQEYAKENQHDRNVELITRIFNGYEDELKRSNAMDFDDLLIKAYELLSTHCEVLRIYQTRFKYILVDEFQDTNAIQYSIVALLARGSGNVFAVGDEDQSIYSWRGADITNIKRFIDDFGAEVFMLEQNYRSTKRIISAANSLIKHNTSRIEKNLWTANSDGEAVIHYVANTEIDEADYIINTINRLRQCGYSPQDFAVLMRVNALTRTPEQRLIQYGIPYRVYGGFKFFDRKEIKDIIAYLRVLSNHMDTDAILRIINVPKRSIGDATLACLKNYADVMNLSLFDVITGLAANEDLPLSVIKKVMPFGELLNRLSSAATRMSVSELTEFTLKQSGMRDAYSDSSEESESRKLNISEFVASAFEFDKNRKGTLDEFLQEVSLYTEGDNNESNAVLLTTVHSAKGMEFRVVFIIGAEEGLFPLSRANDSYAEMEEERRLMYVAVTRAKERVYITSCNTRFLYGDRKYMRQTRFLEEIDVRFSNEGRSTIKPAGLQRNMRSPIQREKPKQVSAYNHPTALPNKRSVSDFPCGTRVRHKKFGSGVVESVTTGENPYIVIKFETVGRMTLSLAFAPIEKE